MGFWGWLFGRRAASPAQAHKVAAHQSTTHVASQRKTPSKPRRHETAVVSGATVDLGDGNGFEMGIVGESYYGLEIKRIAGTRLARGEEVVFTVTLMPEPDNRYDPNAIAVLGPYGKKIGHLSREYAVEYRPLFVFLASQGLAATCSAKMFGGSGHKKNIGVWLDIEPIELLLERFSAGV